MAVLMFIGQVLIGLFGLGIMIFIHELGHLSAGKLLKVKVDTFSLGYGKKLWGFKRGDTTYQIAWFPFGGFTKFKGEHVFAKAIEDNLDRLPPDPDNYYNQAPWKRVIISLAGPLANLLFAIVFFTVIYWIGFNVYSYENRIALASDLSYEAAAGEPNPADRAGLRSGDRVLKINDREIMHFDDLWAQIAASPGQPLAFSVQRTNGLTEKLTVTPRLDKEQARGVIGISYDAEPVISAIAETVADKNVWLKTGDRITAVAGQAVSSRAEVIRAFRDRPKSLPLTVLRNGQPIERAFEPVYEKSGMQSLGLVFAEKPFRTPAFNIAQAFSKGMAEVGSTAYSIVLFISQIPKGINVGKAVSGPLKTTLFIGQVTAAGLDKGIDQGILQFVQFLCFLSVVLALMNLLPLPVLDGGFIILFLIEWIRRKPFRPRFIFVFQMIGVGLLGILFVFVMFNDIFGFGG